LEDQSIALIQSKKEITMHKRLFLALPLPQTTLMLFQRHCSSLRICNVRWTAPENLHITLHFLGNTDENIIPSLVDTCNQFFAIYQPFCLKFKEIIYAPPNDPTRMIWAEYYNNDHYYAMVTQLKKTLAGFFNSHNQTIEQDTKSIIPHVTLARSNGRLFYPTTTLPQPTIPDLPITTVHLMESELQNSGPIYNILEHFNLKT
jgi:RNA 2',3'-cyclic 3'-phosphodiesterase